MFRKTVSKLISVLLALGVLVFLLPTAIPSAAARIDYTPTDVGPKIRQWEATQARISGNPLSADQAGSNSQADVNAFVGDTKAFLILDDYTGNYSFTYFTLVAQGDEAQVWVQDDLAWPDGDPRTTPVITEGLVSYILDEFETNILPTESSFFGTPGFHDGSAALLEDWGYFQPGYFHDDAGRAIILVSNVRDVNYYDPETKIYIAGFYSPTFEAYFDRNIITIDAYDWANRTGPDATKPFLYEGVVAHEWQHLLHDDYDSDEETFINEGMSEYAEILCGYTQSLQGHIDAASSNPENSLVVWGDQGDEEILTDYGQAALFQIYLNQHYGISFTQALFHNQENGTAGVEATLTNGGFTEDFAEVYHGFSLSLYMLGSFNLFPSFQVDVGHPGKPNPEAFGTPGAPPWGTDYFLVWGYEQIASLKFNGFQFNPLSWTSVDGRLWGGTGDLIDNWAIFEATGGGTLTFDTEYDLEELWDYGFVQVSTDDGYTWTSLNNASTTSDHDPNAHPNIIANLPGITGSSDGSVTLSFDLSVYAGQEILIGFRYMTDWAYTEAGWFIDNVYVDDALVSNGSSTGAFMSLNEVLDISNIYSVTLIGERIRKGKVEYEILNILSDGHISDWNSIRQMFDNYNQLIILVTYRANQGVTSYADYYFEIDNRGGKNIK